MRHCSSGPLASMPTSAVPAIDTGTASPATARARSSAFALARRVVEYGAFRLTVASAIALNAGARAARTAWSPCRSASTTISPSAMSGETVRLDASRALPNIIRPRPRPEYSTSTAPDNGTSDVGTMRHDVAVTAAVYSPPFRSYRPVARTRPLRGFSPGTAGCAAENSSSSNTAPPNRPRAWMSAIACPATVARRCPRRAEEWARRRSLGSLLSREPIRSRHPAERMPGRYPTASARPPGDRSPRRARCP